MNDWLLPFCVKALDWSFFFKEIHPKGTSTENKSGMQRTADTKATLHLNILFIYVKHDMFIIKLHDSPRWKSSPLETATVTADTSKCDHNTKTVTLQQHFRQRCSTKGAEGKRGASRGQTRQTARNHWGIHLGCWEGGGGTYMALGQLVTRILTFFFLTYQVL